MTTLPLSESKRDKERLEELMKIRLSHPDLRVIDTPQKRAKLYLLYMADHCVPLKGWLVDKLYDDPAFFERYNFASPDTILRDCRELEILGYFEKA